MKVLIVGLGSIGMRHGRNFEDLDCQIVAGVDPDQSRRERFAQTFPGRAFGDLEEALDTQPDLVVIASPSVFHVAQATTCVARGTHLLIEKPLGPAMNGVPELIHAIEESGVFAHVGSNWKFHPALLTLKRLIDEGVPGPVASAQVLAGQWLPDWHPWEDYRKGYSARVDLGGGVVLDSHEFDCITWLLGPIAELVGLVARSDALETESESVACACVRFESGALASVHVDYIQRDYRRRYLVAGPAGTVEWDYSTALITVYRAPENAGDPPIRETIDVSLEDLNEMYIAQARHVIDGVHGRCPPVTSVSAAAAVLTSQLLLRGLNV
jgi:predicted dehydrogenase